MTPLSQGQALVEPSDADQRVRYCPECGRIGPVPPTFLSCCPDSFGMEVRRWQADKLERMFVRLRGLAASPAAPAADLRAATVNIHRAKLKSRKRMDAEIPRNRQGWWADVCPGARLVLRDATAADIARCSLNEGSSRNPDDYLCELPEDGALVSKAAIEHCRTEVVAARHAAAQLAAVAAPPDQPRTDHIRAVPGGAAFLRVAAVAAPEARIERQSLDHPAVNDSPNALRSAPLSEPCALDQGARPVRLTAERIKELLEQEHMVTGENQFRNGRHFYRSLGHASHVDEHDLFNFARAIERECGIAPPVAQQEGSTQ